MKKQTTIKVTVNVALVVLALSQLIETLHTVGLLYAALGRLPVGGT